MKIAFVGTVSSGKTTLAKRVAEELNGIYVEELARKYIEVFGKKNIKPEDQLFIAILQGQLEMEMRKMFPNELLVFDTPMLLNKIYYKFYNDNSSLLDFFFDLFKYDIIFYLKPLEYKIDKARFQTIEERNKIDELIKENINFVEVPEIDFDKRLNFVINYIKNYKSD